MRICHVLPDGRKCNFGGRQRYVGFRLTQTPYSVVSGPLAADVVASCQRLFDTFGFKHVVIDTQRGEVIATFPYDPKIQPMEAIDG